MAEERRSTPPGDGPYRTAPLRFRIRRSWLPAIVGIAVAIAALITCLLWPGEERHPSLDELPASLFDDVRAWPPPEPDLPPSTPLAPLLVAEQPDALTVMSPSEGATRLRRGESLIVRFNRPMVDGNRVGRPIEVSPLVFDPPIVGAAQWTSRSTISFAPDARAWTSSVREAHVSFREGLTSLSGEPLLDDLERVVVLDGAPRLLTYASGGRVTAGAPLPLFFDAPVRIPSLSREILAYEIDGGARMLPVSLVAARRHPSDRFRVDVRLQRGLEPGAHIGLALAPRYSPYGGGSPNVLTYELAPRPFLEGLSCDEGAAYVGQCAFTEAPGRIIDIGSSLRLLASTRVSQASSTNVRVSPALRDLRVRLAPFGPPQHRLIEIEGEWEPDQVYEVRVFGLRTEEGDPLRPLPPLAVRSSGHAPEIRVATGALTFESDAAPTIPFATIQPGPSDLLVRSVREGDELRALIASETYVRDGAESVRLAPLAPSARANRWGPGRFAWREPAREERMAVVAFRRDASRAPRETQTAFVQSTDLGITVRAHSRGLLVWVTSIASAEPVSGAHITVADADARTRAQGTTDRNGVARIALDASPLTTTHAIRVTKGDDRAAILLDPRRSITPASMGMVPGASPPAEAPVATVFTDRGAYRRGERVRAKIVLREIRGARAHAVRSGRFVVRLFDPSASAPVQEREVRPSRFGTASIELDLASSAPLGYWHLDVARKGRTESIGSAQLEVAEFRQPTFRVDLTNVEGTVHAGDRIGSDASATYLFGAPVTRGRVSWSLVREGAASYPERWARYTFLPVGAGAIGGTIASSEEAIDAHGRLHIDAQVQLATAARSQLALEAAVTDAAGHTHAARRRFVAYPAAFEVGVRSGDDWIALGNEIDLDAVVMAHDGSPAPGHAFEARVVREGWHSWWEWSERAHNNEEGEYQLRRDQRREVVHHCRLTSAGAPVHCRFTPTRPGTYVLEAELRDERGRRSLASRRIYVAGPDEQPDRDPPGAPIAVTPTRASWTVGETAELAFESPFASADALITVEREGVTRVERRRVAAGGQVIRVPLTDAMVPNVFVGVTLVAPRSGAPAEHVDLHAPDLRFGMAELTVEPATSALQVTIEATRSARPGTRVPIAVRVTDARGRPARAEVALWAVDEGTLRLTGYEVPDPTIGIYRPHPPAFAWEDLRRSLVSRIEAPPMPRASGDGGQGQSAQRSPDERERFDPTPLWMPLLTTDAGGRAEATVELPLRPTEYRVMAVAIDAGARSGNASSTLTAEQPLTIRPAFPAFVTAGDRFEASVFVHNTTEAPIQARVWASIGGERRAARTIRIEAGGEARVAEPLTAPRQGPLALRFEAQAGGERTSSRADVPIAPRARFVRSQIFVAGRGSREIRVGLPPHTPPSGASASITVASHPFVGFDGAVESLEQSRWQGTEPLASTLLAFCAQADLGTSTRVPDHELSARARSVATELAALGGSEGGFGRWSSFDGIDPQTTAIAVHALACAKRHRWIDEATLVRARAPLVGMANGSDFGDYYGESGLDENAYALRVLSEAGVPQEARASALYEQRERLSPFGRAQLAIALGADDERAVALITSALRTVFKTRDDEASDPASIRWNDRSARVFGAVLEAASRSSVGHTHTGKLAGNLLALRGTVGSASPWGSPIDTARALTALAAYARLWRWDDDDEPQVLLDGQELPAVSRTRAGAQFHLPIRRIVGTHRLRVIGEDDRPLFFAVDGRWPVPLSDVDNVARGRRVAVHRVYETPEGRPIAPGERIALGAMVRVRLYVYDETGSAELTALHDPLPAGFEAVDAGHDTTPQSSLMALMGMSPDDDVVDARAQHAMRSMENIAHRTFDTAATTFYFERVAEGLSEFTYAIRATTVGEFTAPPAELEALHDPSYVARTTIARLRVAERE